jgi:nanoRNase/pAp phosphatase (c-di-AMP/oligoRNAs hydrolase)
VDAIELTGLWGGGGHARAAGATVDLTVGQAEPIVLDAARHLIAQLPHG